MIVLKHLAREFNLNPYPMRQFLRKTFPKHRGQWKWQDDDPKLHTIREALRQHSNANAEKSSHKKTRAPSSAAVAAKS